MWILMGFITFSINFITGFSTILSHVSNVYLLFLLPFLQFFCRPKVRRAASKSLTRLGDGIAPEILAIIRSVEDTVDQAIG